MTISPKVIYRFNAITIKLLMVCFFRTRTKILKLYMQKHIKKEFQINIYFCFIEYTKAFDCMDHSKLWKIFKVMGTPDHLTCLLRYLCAGQEATVRTGHGTTDWFQIGKGVCQGCIMSPCLFNLYAEYIMSNAGLEKHSWNQDCQEQYQ